MVFIFAEPEYRKAYRLQFYNYTLRKYQLLLGDYNFKKIVFKPILRVDTCLRIYKFYKVFIFSVDLMALSYTRQIRVILKIPTNNCCLNYARS